MFFDRSETATRLKSTIAYGLCALSALIGIGLLVLVVGYLLQIGLFNDARYVRFTENEVTYDMYVLSSSQLQRARADAQFVDAGDPAVEPWKTARVAVLKSRPGSHEPFEALWADSVSELHRKHPQIVPLWDRAIRPRTDLFTEVPIYFGDIGFPGGMLNGLIGTAILVGLASLLGVPLGVLAGIHLAEYDAKSVLARPVRFICDVLAGVPSIVVGVLGYELLVVPFTSGQLFGIDLPMLKNMGIAGNNGYAGALALAFIMIPIVARTTEEMLRLVPNSYREASIALGATKARTILRVILPAATGSVVTGIMLAIARIAGETAPLLFTALGSSYLETNPTNPFPSLTVMVYKAASQSPYLEDHRMAQFGILVLIAMIFVINLMIRYFASRVRRLA